jgi:hypothetical protein
LSSLIILTIIFWNSIFDVSSSSQLFKSLVVEFDFEGELLSCCVEIYTVVVVFGSGSNPLCPCGWGFMKDCTGLDSGFALIFSCF